MGIQSRRQSHVTGYFGLLAYRHHDSRKLTLTYEHRTLYLPISSSIYDAFVPLLLASPEG